MYKYAHALDSGDTAAFLDCFTETASYGSTPSGRMDRGHGEIADFFGRHSHAPEAWHKHLMVEPRITITGDRAGGVSYYALIQTRASGPFISHFGRYLDVFVRCPDGAWRIQSRLNVNEGVAPGDVTPHRDKVH
jgi:ketosteroid isomerase-like protein